MGLQMVLPFTVRYRLRSAVGPGVWGCPQRGLREWEGGYRLRGGIHWGEEEEYKTKPKKIRQSPNPSELDKAPTQAT